MISFEQAADLFIENVKFQAGMTGNTAVSYSVDLAQFASYIEKLGIESISDITPKTIKSYIREMSNWYAKSSISRKLSALRSFFSFTMKLGSINNNPIKTIKGVTSPRPLPKAVSRETIDKMLELVKESKNRERDTLIFELLYGAGLRISELASLKWEDIDNDSRWLIVSGKGDKQRRVPFGRFAAKAIEDVHNKCGQNIDFVLPDDTGRKSINVRTIHRIVTGIAKKAGAFSVTPHVLRHSCATHMLEGGASLRFIQEFLGHENLSTTQVYLTISASRMKESYAKSHPRACFEEGDD
jgi:integrase/recombinase XerC